MKEINNADEYIEQLKSVDIKTCTQIHASHDERYVMWYSESLNVYFIEDRTCHDILNPQTGHAIDRGEAVLIFEEFLLHKGF